MESIDKVGWGAWRGEGGEWEGGGRLGKYVEVTTSVVVGLSAFNVQLFFLSSEIKNKTKNYNFIGFYMYTKLTRTKTVKVRCLIKIRRTA